VYDINGGISWAFVGAILVIALNPA
jgi:hypothetical protein